MDKNAITDNEMDDIIIHMMNHVTAPMKFSEDDNKLGAALVDQLLLYKEFVIVREFAKQRAKNTHKLVTILHQIEKGSTYYTELFQWKKMGDVMNVFFMPIHYQIYCNRTPPPEYTPLRNNTTTTTTNDDDNSVPQQRVTNSFGVDKKMRELQNKIIISHFNRSFLRPRDLLGCIEHGILDVTLSKIIIHLEIIMFLFQWSEPTPFVFVLGFSIQYTDERLYRFINEKFIELSRKDLVEWVEPTEEEKEKLDTMIVEEGDDESHVNSEKAFDAYGLKMTLLRRELQSSFISYISLAYVRRDQ